MVAIGVVSFLVGVARFYWIVGPADDALPRNSMRPISMFIATCSKKGRIPNERRAQNLERLVTLNRILGETGAVTMAEIYHFHWRSIRRT